MIATKEEQELCDKICEAKEFDWDAAEKLFAQISERELEELLTTKN